ncbi:hypothetical protein T4D_11417 [Trichinella pseudospiralis]|uniref:Uncharacterized protein n=1 Tax=Trichinella pseudospiralis TaxID=6337 RepID=A0A0V1FCQ6_TRIPS|nr:hypothetical protein T4D_11417 [Trichinella pseudospiralis]
MGHRLRRNRGRRRRSHRPRRDADVPAQTHHRPVIYYESRTADQPEPEHMRAQLKNHNAGSGDTSRDQQSSDSRPNQRSGVRKRWQSDRRSHAHANSTAVENGAPTSDASHGRRPRAYNNRRRTNELRSVDAASGEANTTDPRAGRTRTGHTSRATGQTSRATGQTSRATGQTSSASDGRITHRSSPSTDHSSHTAGHAHVRAARTRGGHSDSSHADTGHAPRKKTRANENGNNSSNSRTSLRREERSRANKHACNSSTRQTTATTSNTARRRTHQTKMRRDAQDTGLNRVDSNPDRSTGPHMQPELNRHDDQAADYTAGDSQQNTDDDELMNEVHNVDIRNMGSTVAGKSFFYVKNFKPLSSSKNIRLKMLKRFEKLYRKGSRYEESLLRRMRSTTVEPPVDETVHFKSIIMVSKRRFHKAKR